MTENGKKVRKMALGYIKLVINNSIREVFIIALGQGSDSNYFQMEISTKVNTKKESLMEKAGIFGLTDQPILESLLMDRDQDLESGYLA